MFEIISNGQWSSLVVSSWRMLALYVQVILSGSWSVRVVDSEVCFPFPGMTVRDFLGFPSLQEVECSGGSLKTKVNYLSLTLFKMSDKSVIATLISSKNTCKTFLEFSSCTIDSSDSRKSMVRTLVADLEEGGSTALGCNVTTVLESGHPRVFSWSLLVRRRSECLCLCLSFLVDTINWRNAFVKYYWHHGISSVLTFEHCTW